VQRQVARRLVVDAVEEVQELTRPVPRHASADHLPIEEIERGKERRGAMAVVVVRLPGGDARAQREQGCRPVEGLNLALLIDREHQGVLGAHLLPLVRAGVGFVDGVQQAQKGRRPSTRAA